LSLEKLNKNRQKMTAAILFVLFSQNLLTFMYFCSIMMTEKSKEVLKMKPIIISKKFELTEDIKDRIYKKLNKLNKFFDTETEATVRLKEERGRVIVEITIYKGSSIFRAEEFDKDPIFAIDHAVDVIERQIRKNRTRLYKRLYSNDNGDFVDVDSVDSEIEEEIRISKVKKFEFAPMTVEEAIMQMNLLSHEFFMFRNAETGVYNLVYKRKENDYGLIEPKE
jgi:putative sigma-54 modulation protein